MSSDDDESWGSDDRRPSWTVLVLEQTLGLLLIMRMKSEDLTLFVLKKKNSSQCLLCKGGGTLREQAMSKLDQKFWLLSLLFVSWIN